MNLSPSLLFLLDFLLILSIIFSYPVCWLQLISITVIEIGSTLALHMIKLVFFFAFL